MVEVQTLGKISCRCCTDSRFSQPFLIINTRNGINCWSNFEWSNGLKVFQLQIYFWSLNLCANIIQFYMRSNSYIGSYNIESIFYRDRMKYFRLTLISFPFPSRDRWFNLTSGDLIALDAIFRAACFISWRDGDSR